MDARQFLTDEELARLDEQQRRETRAKHSKDNGGCGPGDDGFGGFGGAPQGHNEENFGPEGGFGGFGATRRGHNAKISSPEWEEPKPIEASLPAVAAFDPNLLPSAIGDYVLDVADRQQSPPDFAAVAALCGLAALAGNRVRIKPKQFDDWEVVPNLWGALIGAPSSMKTPAMRSALGPLWNLQDQLRKDWEAAQHDFDVEAEMAALDAKTASKKAATALRHGDRGEAKRILSESAPDTTAAVPCPRLIVNDATVEKLGELLNQNPRGLLLIRDELPGWLAKLESDDHQSERAFYLEAYNGDGQFTYDRILRGTVHIENCTISIIGGVQPSRIVPLVRGAISGTSDDGLIQRLQLAVWPDDISEWKWRDRRPDEAARDRYTSAFHDIHEFTAKLEAPAVFSFSDAAQAIFQEWMTELQTSARSGKHPPALESHLLKMPNTIASLALLFELVEGGRGTVGKVAAARAFGWAEYLQTHSVRLYTSGSVLAEHGARILLERRAQLPGPFTARTVRKKAWAGLGDQDAVASAIDALVAASCCREAVMPSSVSGGRPTVGYDWNPKLESV
jgi:Protein of unknown function (DUF3987)